MKIAMQEQVFGVTIGMKSLSINRMPRLLLENSTEHYVPTPAKKSLAVKQKKIDSVLKRVNKLGEKAHGIREHIKLGAKITEIVKGKLSLGARILQLGGVKKVYRQLFKVEEGENLLKACQCYLSTSAGPMPGLLFISTQKVAFCSERSIKVSSPDGNISRIHYKVLIPLKKIKVANQNENMKKPSQKYMEIVTVDNFDFWFMGFFNYQKSFNCLQQAIFQALSNTGQMWF